MNNHLFFAFQSKSFRNLWLAEIFTQIPINILNFILVLIVFNLTKSNTAVSGIVLSFTLPAVFFGILAGIYIDHWNKQHVLLICNISRMIFLILLAVFVKNLFLIFTLSILITIVTQFFIPAESPMIPLLVEKKHLLSANALFGVGIFSSLLLAYLLSGPLLLFLGTVRTLLLLAVMLGISSFFISLITVPESEKKKHFRIGDIRRIPFWAIRHEIGKVFSIIRASTEVSSSLFLIALAQILILIIAAIAPGYASEVLRISPEEFPILLVTPATIGLVIGALLIANVMFTLKKENIVNIGIFLCGIVMTIMPYGSRIASKEFVQVFNSHVPRIINISNLHIIIILTFILGIGLGFIFIPSNTILQEKTADEMRGKVYGVLSTLTAIFSFIPVLAVGSFSDLIGVSSVLVGIGCSFLLIGLVKLLK